MQIKEAKAWLQRGIELQKEIERLEKAKAEVYDRLTSKTGQSTGDVVSSTKDPHKYDMLAELSAELDARIAESYHIQAEILRAIGKVQKTNYRNILHCRYYMGMRWEDIAKDMHYHKRHIERMHGEALKQIAPIIEAMRKK